MIIGIDPGVNCGVAIFSGGELKKLYTFSGINLIEWLPYQTAAKTIVIEDSRLQSFLFSGAQQNKAQSLKIARNVGMVDMVCHMIESLCEKSNVDLIGISPKSKGKKLQSTAFNLYTGWTEKSNQHERDAAMVAWPYRGIK